jgi:hypothetical protein
MAITREQIEGQITAKMEQHGIPRPEAIEELLDGAKKGAGRAEKEVMDAQFALAQAQTDDEIDNLMKKIESEGRYASLENDRIAWLKHIAKEDNQNQQ